MNLIINKKHETLTRNKKHRAESAKFERHNIYKNGLVA